MPDRKPTAEERKQQRAEEQRRRIDEAVREIVDKAPPLTPEQIDRLRALLAPHLRR